MNIVKMKKVIICVLLGTIITACSTQKKAVEVANATPSPQSVKVDSINNQKHEELIEAKESKVDTVVNSGTHPCASHSSFWILWMFSWVKASIKLRLVGSISWQI